MTVIRIGKIKRLLNVLRTIKSLYYNDYPQDFASCGENVILEQPCKVNKPQNIYMGSNIAIRGFFTFISHTGRLYIKDNCDISQCLTVITGNHTIKPDIDKWQIESNHMGIGDDEKDTVIEEDVWIGFHVTLLPGVRIGRGSIIGAGSVVTKSIPPYTIAAGSPCRVIRMKYSKEEILVREKKLYSPPASVIRHRNRRYNLAKSRKS